MYKIEIDNIEKFKSDDFGDILKYLDKMFGQNLLNKCYHEFYGNGSLIEWYYIPYNNKLINISIINIEKVNVVDLLKKNNKSIRLNKYISLEPGKKYHNRKCPQIDPDFYNSEGYIRRGYDGYLWITKKKNNKYIWTDYISPL